MKAILDFIKPINLSVNDNDFRVYIDFNSAFKDGANGESAYAVAVRKGFIGTEEDWLNTLIGATGATGATGPAGVQGAPGINGEDGLSAYELAVLEGYTSDLTTWLSSLEGTSIVWKGTWIAATEYLLNDVVEYLGSSYICTVETNSDVLPDAYTHWELVAEKGGDGDQGPQGVQGLQGVQGIQGIQGTVGIQGPAGEPGTSITMKGTVATTGDLPMVGNNVNDAYICSADGDLYVWDGAAWNNVGQIVGPQGPQGIQGPQGPIGLTGLQGVQGLQGLQGIQGVQGIPGTNGVSILWKGTFASAPAVPQLNWAYYNSTDKKSYIYDGSTWTLISQDGAQGIQGIQGPQGPEGPKGDAGDPGVFGQLNTLSTTALVPEASEEFSTEIALHKVAKTGTYSDLIGAPMIFPYYENATQLPSVLPNYFVLKMTGSVSVPGTSDHQIVLSLDGSSFPLEANCHYMIEMSMLLSGGRTSQQANDHGYGMYRFAFVTDGNSEIASYYLYGRSDHLYQGDGRVYLTAGYVKAATSPSYTRIGQECGDDAGDFIIEDLNGELSMYWNIIGGDDWVQEMVYSTAILNVFKHNIVPSP